MKQMLVVGMGLIGGSMAMALKDFEDYEVVGGVRSRKTYDKALEMGAAHRLTFDPASELPNTDIVILAQDPAGIIGFLEENREKFKPGSLILDVCGVKTAIMEAAKCLPESVDFVGCHPMAGKEVSGIAHAEGTLFRNTHFIVTPGEHTTPEHLDLIHRIAEHCRFRDVVSTTCTRHDEIIAYTSQLMHVIAVSVCDNEELFSCMGFEGGSFRDCTRVAALDVGLWTQLFSLNAPALGKMIGQLEDRLHSYRMAIEAGDLEALSDMLTSASERKKQLNIEQARGDDVRIPFEK